MIDQFFPPIQGTKKGLDIQALLKGATISVAQLVTGSLQVGQDIMSGTYVPGSDGWIIRGDGSAEFNNVTIRGDLVSSNWNGGTDLSTGPDAGATQGFFLDSSVGSGQLEGSLYVGGDIELDGGTLWATQNRAAGSHYLAIGNPWGTGQPNWLTWWNGSTERGIISVGTGTYGIMTLNADSGTDWSTVSATQTAFELAAGDSATGWGRGMVDLYVGLRSMTNAVQWIAPQGSVSAPGLTFSTLDLDTGIYWWGADALAVATGGNRMIWVGPSQTRYYSGVWLVGPSSTVAGPRYMSWYLSDETTRSGWIGYGGANEHFGIYNERPAGNVSIYAHNGTSVVSRIIIDADGATLFYGRDGSNTFRTDIGYVRLMAGVSLQFNGTTVPRLELGANNSIQVTNSSGWLQIGPQNTWWCHIYTDRPGFYFNKDLYVNGNKVWHAGNDGGGSGLNADLLDGVQGSNYLRSNTTDYFTGSVLYTNHIYPNLDNYYNLGSSTRRWYTVYRLAESSSSDRRLKKHISDKVPGLDLIMSLRPRRFKYKKHTNEWWWGLIAQEVAEVVDREAFEIIHNEDPDRLGINYEQLIAPLIKAVQELKEELDELKYYGVVS